MQEPDYYAILGVAPTSEDVVIEGAYKALMRKYHPDRNGSGDAQQRATLINNAYRILRNPDSREQYDARRLSQDAASAEPRASQQPPGDAARSTTMAGGFGFLAVGVIWLIFGIASVAISAVRTVRVFVASGLRDLGSRHAAGSSPAPPRSASAAMPLQREGRSGFTIAFGLLSAFLVVAICVAFVSQQSRRASVLSQEASATVPDQDLASYLTSIDNPPSSAPYDLPAALPVETPPAPAIDETPTVAEVDAAMTEGVNLFASAFKQGGVSYAEAQSIACHNQARLSQRIIDTDRCAAIDFAAQYVDSNLSKYRGTPPNSYFAGRDTELEHDYGRFSTHAPIRLSLVKQFALGALMKLPQSAIE